MGAGSFPAGKGPAGFDPPFVVTGQSPAPYAAAIEYDMASRSFPLDAGGDQIPQDPVDQKVALLLGLEYGAVASAPDSFNKLRLVLNRVPDSSKLAIARQELNRVLKPLLEAGDITINSVTVADVARGTTQVGLSYTNLRTGVTPPTLPVL